MCGGVLRCVGIIMVLICVFMYLVYIDVCVDVAGWHGRSSSFFSTLFILSLGLSLNMELSDLAHLGSHPDVGTPILHVSCIAITSRPTCPPDTYICAEDLKFNPYVCVTYTSFIEPSSHRVNVCVCVCFQVQMPVYMCKLQDIKGPTITLWFISLRNFLTEPESWLIATNANDSLDSGFHNTWDACVYGHAWLCEYCIWTQEPWACLASTIHHCLIFPASLSSLSKPHYHL